MRQQLEGLKKTFNVEDTTSIANNYILYTLIKTQSMFAYSGLPDTIPQRDLELMLQCCGYVGITDVDGKLYALWGGLGGVPNAYYMPTILTVANPALQYNKELTIGEDCIIVPSDSMYVGLYPIIAKYAVLMAENVQTLRLKGINYRLPYLIAAGDDATKESADKFIKDLLNGKVSVIGDNAFLESLKVFTQPSSNSITEVIEYQQYLEAKLLNELGLQANFNLKRERLVQNEIDANIDGTLPLIDDMLRNRQQAISKVNAKYGTDISVELYSAWQDTDKRGGEDDGERNNQSTVTKQ